MKHKILIYLYYKKETQAKKKKVCELHIFDYSLPKHKAKGKQAPQKQKLNQAIFITEQQRQEQCLFILAFLGAPITAPRLRQTCEIKEWPTLWGQTHRTGKSVNVRYLENRNISKMI